MKIELKKQVFKDLKKISEDLDMEAYVVGGYVRDTILGTPNDDIDVVVVGSGPKFAQAYADYRGEKVQIYENFGTAKVGDLEFVGARKESYERGSRKPIVEDGTLEDDLTRRDFTLNAMAINLKTYDLVDLFNGLQDLSDGILKTPTDPNITFSDDPLRMLRCIRFACRFGFTIDMETYGALKTNKERIRIISAERIATELGKILMSGQPGRGFMILEDVGLLQIILPELSALDDSGGEGIMHHKNNFIHSVKVLDNVSRRSESLWLRWAAILHDIGKEPTKQFDEEEGWSFVGHELVGANMVERIFRRLKLPLDDKLEFVKKMVSMHMRPSMISTREIKDSAVRRLLSDAGEDFDDLMILCESDLTTKNDEKRARIGDHFVRLHEMVDDLRKRDYVRLFQPCIGGNEIMEMFNLRPCRLVGDLKKIIKDAVLEGTVENTPEALEKLLKKEYENRNNGRNM